MCQGGSNLVNTDVLWRCLVEPGSASLEARLGGNPWGDLRGGPRAAPGERGEGLRTHLAWAYNPLPHPPPGCISTPGLPVKGRHKLSHAIYPAEQGGQKSAK